ncbi:lipoyl(octanoyl) transferase LipB [Basilea psittacipulmonis]|uniref:Octanoyltransferase n=1 Tax=Basilea psittacipulmonis DSM 24701 TaxID=1072685 RepID=A0A077DAS4_9BURK|nr:lipoyl(octanoyl) transferase LipB [Basilea psittacipulmonis]AIL32005.1 lipoate--protein ligase [Basilea psittacipulmonis DSM 24701]
MSDGIEVRYFAGLTPYQSCWDAMKAFTEQRDEQTTDQLWIVEHEPVYTLGQAGKTEHILNPGNIPIVKCNRGGQVTYHGPGQVVLYPLIDLHRYGLFVREYVTLLEDVALDTLRDLGVTKGCRKEGAPGIYVNMPEGDLAKIAALGVKVTKGSTYHGMAFNVDMDLRPFLGINPCGYAGMRTIDLKTLGIQKSWQEVATILEQHILNRLKQRRQAVVG